MNSISSYLSVHSTVEQSNEKALQKEVENNVKLRIEVIKMTVRSLLFFPIND